MPGPAWPPDMSVDDEQCWSCQRYKMSLSGTNATTIHPTCGHLDLRRADNLHSKFWPLASGSSFGDMSGVFHNTETSRAKLMPEDQIVKPSSTMHADRKSGFQANSHSRIVSSSTGIGQKMCTPTMCASEACYAFKCHFREHSTLHCMASVTLAISESLQLLCAKTSHLNSGRSVGVGSNCSSCHEGPDDSSVVFGVIFRMNSRTLLSPGLCCFTAAAASTGSSPPLLATGATLLICGFAPPWHSSEADVADEDPVVR